MINKFFILLLISFTINIMGCSIEKNYNVVNQVYNLDICHYGDGIYYITYKNNLVLNKYNTWNKNIETLVTKDSGGLTSICVVGNIVYYLSLENYDTVILNKFDGENNIELLKTNYNINTKNLFLKNVNGELFFFNGNSLYTMEKEEIKLLKTGVKCVYIFNNEICYVLDDGVYFCDYNNNNEYMVLAKSEIDNKCISNILRIDDTLYFILSDDELWRYGNLYKYNLTEKKLEKQSEEILYTEFQIYDEEMYFTGCTYSDNGKETGLFKKNLNNEKIEKLYSKNVSSFFVDDKGVYLTCVDEDFEVIVIDKKGKEIILEK